MPQTETMKKLVQCLVYASTKKHYDTTKAELNTASPPDFFAAVQKNWYSCKNMCANYLVKELVNYRINTLNFLESRHQKLNKTDVERQQTLGHPRSINPNMITHFTKQSYF